MCRDFNRIANKSVLKRKVKRILVPWVIRSDQVIESFRIGWRSKRHHSWSLSLLFDSIKANKASLSKFLLTQVLQTFLTDIDAFNHDVV